MEKFMLEALKEAEKAGSIGEVPIGAVIVKDGVIVGRGHNMTESAKDPTAHAEILAIRQAAANLGGWRLFGTEIDVYKRQGLHCAYAALHNYISVCLVQGRINSSRL